MSFMSALNTEIFLNIHTYTFGSLGAQVWTFKGSDLQESYRIGPEQVSVWAKPAFSFLSPNTAKIVTLPLRPLSIHHVLTDGNIW